MNKYISFLFVMIVAYNPIGCFADAEKESAEKAVRLTKEQAKAQISKTFDLSKAPRTLTKDEQSMLKGMAATALCQQNLVIDEIFKNEISTIEASNLENQMKNMEAEIAKKKGSPLNLAYQLCGAHLAAQVTKLIDIDDLRVDFDSLVGNVVRVAAMGYYIGNNFVIKRNSTDMNLISVNILQIPRDQKKEIFQKCGDIRAGCKVVIFGTVVKQNFRNEFFALSIEWK